MTTTRSDTRPLRADAERNRLRLVRAAAAAFAEHGLDVTVAEITHEAGVGKGTFFRNFPTKESLVVAVVRHRLGEFLASGQALLEHDDPGHALREFMRAGVLLMSTDRCFQEVSGGCVVADDEVRRVHDDLVATAGRLVERAQRHGVLRDDVTAADILLLAGAASAAAAPLRGVRPDLWQRYLDVIFDGLGPDGAHPLSVPAPVKEHFDAKFDAIVKGAKAAHGDPAARCAAPATES